MGKKPKKPSIKQLKYVKGTAENAKSKHPKTKKQIAKEAGYSDSLAHNPQQIERRCKGLLLDALDKEGLTEEFIAKGIKEGCEAHKVEVAKYEGQICDERSYVDHPTRKGFFQMACELRGDLEPEKEGKTIINIQQNILHIQKFVGTREVK